HTPSQGRGSWERTENVHIPIAVLPSSSADFKSVRVPIRASHRKHFAHDRPYRKRPCLAFRAIARQKLLEPHDRLGFAVLVARQPNEAIGFHALGTVRASRSGPRKLPISIPE